MKTEVKTKSSQLIPASNELSAVLARAFDECREGQMPRQLATGYLTSLKYDEVYREVFAHESVRKQFLSDVMGSPLESIRTARLVTPHLWRRYRRQKLGILDIALELNDDTKVNVKLQGSGVDDWIRLFNAKSEELDMLAVKNKGLAEAAEVIKRMSLGKTLRYWYEHSGGNRFTSAEQMAESCRQSREYFGV